MIHYTCFGKFSSDVRQELTALVAIAPPQFGVDTVQLSACLLSLSFEGHVCAGRTELAWALWARGGGGLVKYTPTLLSPEPQSYFSYASLISDVVQWKP